MSAQCALIRESGLGAWILDSSLRFGMTGMVPRPNLPFHNGKGFCGGWGGGLFLH